RQSQAVVVIALAPQYAVTSHRQDVRRQLFGRSFAGTAGNADNGSRPLLINLSRQRLESRNHVVDDQEPIDQRLQIDAGGNSFAPRHRRDGPSFKGARDKSVAIDKRAVEAGAFVVRL